MFPHEVVGFSGGNKYLFPGIAGPEIINFFHWLGAVITNPLIIGTKHTPVRKVVETAAAMVPVAKFCVAMVVVHKDLHGLYLGELFLTWQDDSFDNLPVPLTQVVPFVRVEKYEMNDGQDDRADLILNLTAYWTENLSSSFEYFQTMDGPDDRRFTLYLIFGV